MNAMDIDEIPCGSSKEERDTHAAKKVLKMGHRQKMILDTFKCYHEVINDLLLKHKVRPPKILQRYYNTITMAHSIMIDTCDEVLILQGKKKLITSADSYHTKLQKGAEKLHNAIALSNNRPALSQTPLDRLDAMNAKLKKNTELVKAQDKNNVISHTSNFISSEKPIRKSTRLALAQKTYPYVIDGETETTFLVREGKNYVLPNPAKNDQHSKQYSIRETVLYLHKYRGDGTKSLFLCMKQFHRVAFGWNTYHKYAKEYSETQKLPEEGVMFVPAGRKAASPDTLALNKDAKKRVNVAIDLVKTTEDQITKYRKMKDGSKAKAPSRSTVLKHAAMAPMLDKDVEMVRKNALSESRSIAEVPQNFFESFRCDYWMGKGEDQGLNRSV
jgi:hypothetical protein